MPVALDRRQYWRSYREKHSEQIREAQRVRRRAQTKWERRSIVAWDGEGCNLGDRQLYVLLANSRGESLVNRGGLTTVDCLRFLTDHAEPGDINVIFGGSYDANMWLADLPRKNLEQIWRSGQTHFAGYLIRYQWRKCFIAKSADTGRTATIWDVLGFFQTRFVDTVKLWLPEVDVTEMEQMKEARPDFDLRDLERIISYNADECRLLVRVCESLFAAFDVAGIRLNRYDGAGAIAAALLRANGVLEHKGQLPPRVQEAAQFAYAGGRIEAPRAGCLDEGAVYRADINSAYPTHIRNLPCLAAGHGRWVHHVKSARARVGHFAVLHVRWAFDKPAPFYPFFYREHDGRILFPSEGEGWYWSPEVVAAQRCGAGSALDIVESYEWEQSCNCEAPFEWVCDLYEERQQFKKMLDAGDPNGRAELPVKLGLNSLYGKMAQQVGAKHGAPTFHNLAWAGYVTSCTRASLYETAMQHPKSVIAFATDAIISTERFDVPYGKGLGEWSGEQFDGIVLVQPGVYFLRQCEKEWETAHKDAAKYRGFDKGTLVRDEILAGWVKGCRDKSCARYTFHDHIHATCTRFVGAGSALASPVWYHRWRTWRTDERLLHLLPAGKRRHDPRIFAAAYARGLVATLPQVNRTPDVISAAYPLSWIDDGVSSLLKEEIEGIDVRIVENEYVDSWD